MVDFVRKGQKELPLANIIMQAGYNLAHATQWTDSLSMHHQAESIYAAKELIEMAEIMTCGSIGGFGAVKVGRKYIYQESGHWDKESRWSESGKYDRLFERWLWLFTFYVGRPGECDDVELGHSGWRTVGNLKKFYKRK
jgi:hypothetical protein